MLLVCLAATVSACGGNKKKGGIDEDLAQQQLQELYDKGKTALEKGNYGFAIDFYRALEANYPYGELTEQAKLDMMFAFDKTNQVEKAVEAADNFIKLYPTHKNVDYAYYMKGVASFEKKAGRIDKFIKGGNTLRDPKPLRDSQSAFEELIKRYPDSTYTKDAEQRIVFIRNALAERELYVAQFYFENETYVATVNRCKTIIYKYETSPAVEGALILMEKAYIEMGLDELASSTRTVLNQNFPQNKQAPYKKKKGFFARINPF
ncbi:MAG: outer membrane protein assembly factor BamD [Arenicella sp.]|jgi:outer membrane protein assembly factor BamD